METRLENTGELTPVQRSVREVGELGSATRIAAWVRDVRSIDTYSEDAEASPDEANARLVVAEAAQEFLADVGGDGRAFLTWVRTNRPFDDLPGGTSGNGEVELLTFHGAKGREWSTVVVTGCEKGLMPHSSAKSPQEFGEETRLAYVAFTRAADRLILTHAESRRGRTRTASPYLQSVPTSPTRSAPSREFVEGEAARRADNENQVDHGVLDSLRNWRKRAASSAGVDPTFICTDSVLRRIAEARPATIDELSAIDGVGAMFATRVGSRVLAAISGAVSSSNANE